MKYSPVTILTGIAALCAALLLVNSCQGRVTRAGDAAGSGEQASDLASAELPELATIGGAQDVWPFEFGLDATRAEVEAVMGAAESASERPAGTESSPGRVVSWTYPTVEFRFFVGSDGAEEFLLAATITSAEEPLRGGLFIGMPIDDAVAILGKPDVENESLLVYFYFNSTIELYKSNGTVDAVMLARALP